jgi:hypothetical protein
MAHVVNVTCLVSLQTSYGERIGGSAANRGQCLPLHVAVEAESDLRKGRWWTTFVSEFKLQCKAVVTTTLI